MAEKRRKLKETWDRVISMYEKDAPEQWEDLKKLWMNYQVSWCSGAPWIFFFFLGGKGIISWYVISFLRPTLIYNPLGEKGEGGSHPVSPTSNWNLLNFAL